MKKVLTVSALRKLEYQVTKGEISYSRMVEVINEMGVQTQKQELENEPVEFLEWVAGKNYHQLHGGICFRQAESQGIEQLLPTDLYKLFKQRKTQTQ